MSGLGLNDALAELDKTYCNDPNVQLRSRLAMASSLMKSGEPKKAAQLAAEAAAALASLPQLFAADAALSVASQLRALGQSEASDTLLKTCVEAYGDDPQVMQGVARQTDNSDILSGGKEAVELNRQGEPAMGPFSIFSDCFAAMGAAAMYKATGEAKP